MAGALIDLGLVGKPCIIGGHTYTIGSEGSLGSQESPFNDGTHGSDNYTITSIKTGASVSTSTLGIKLIERYGFYQGPGTPYRSAPEDIIRTFTHLQRRP